MKHQSQQKKGKLASRKHLSADSLFKGLHKDFLSISDHREGDTDISMADALMSGFAVFSLKDPSLLYMYIRMLKSRRRLVILEVF